MVTRIINRISSLRNIVFTGCVHFVHQRLRLMVRFAHRRLRLTGLAIFAISFWVSLHIPLDKAKLSPESVTSLQILDRNGILLREVLSDQEGRGQWVELGQISPYMLKATIAAEDRRYYKHSGVDFLAIGRAFWQNFRARKIVSGGSTITQQLVRSVYNLPRRKLLRKLIEMWYALRLERMLSKEQIMAQYLNRVPYGNQTFGVEAASRLYFDKPAMYLGLAESAFLAAIPKAPSKYGPYRRFDEVRKRQRTILARMLSCEELIASFLATHFITDQQFRAAVSEPINLASKEFKFRAPHFTDAILRKIDDQRRYLTRIETTLDYNLQNKVEALVRRHVKSLSKNNVTNAAVIVMENSTGDILVMVGSADYFDSEHSGQVNGALSLRQPGSTLKPFTYALALEKGMTAATIVADVETHITCGGQDFAPINYDRKYHGPVRLRIALANSYNVPAVRTLQEVGVENLLKRLVNLGFNSLNKSSEYYGLALTLGSGEVTLLELVRAYACLYRGGIYKDERMVLTISEFGIRNSELKNPQSAIRKFLSVSFGQTPNSELGVQEDRRVFSPEVAYLITDILKDADARIPAFGATSPINLPFPCAVKTGTSKDFRDNWTIGYTTKYTVGTWVGNFDGQPMHQVSGVTGAGTLFRDIMLLLSEKEEPEPFPAPENIIRCPICPLSGQVPNEYCPGKVEELFLKGTEPKEKCSIHRGMLIHEEDRISLKLFEVYPPTYASWANKMGITHEEFGMRNAEFGIKKQFRNPKSEIRNPKSGESAFRIAFPEHGSVFRIDPVLRREYQKIRLETVVPEGVNKIIWFVDGKKYSETGSPFTSYWQLEKGIHKFYISARVEGGEVQSEEVRISVM